MFRVDPYHPDQIDDLSKHGWNVNRFGFGKLLTRFLQSRKELQVTLSLLRTVLQNKIITFIKISCTNDGFTKLTVSSFLIHNYWLLAYNLEVQKKSQFDGMDAWESCYFVSHSDVWALCYIWRCVLRTTTDLHVVCKKGTPPRWGKGQQKWP